MIRVTSHRLLACVLAIQLLLWSSEHWQWFWFNERKGGTVLLAVLATGVFMVVLGIRWGVQFVFRGNRQFSIASFMLLLAVLAVPLGWFSESVRAAQRQADAVAALTPKADYLALAHNTRYALHAKYLSNTDGQLSRVFPTPAWAWLRNLLGEHFFFDIGRLNLYGPEIGDDDMRLVGQLTGLRELDLSRTAVTDAGLHHLAHQRWLRTLGLWETHISDAGLAELVDLPALELLKLPSTNIGDGGLEHVSRIQNLDSLILDNTHVTDAGLRHLRQLKHLTYLSLDNTRVTDAGLSHLAQLRRLTYVSLYDTSVTPDGSFHLHQALPNCDVVVPVERPVSELGNGQP